MDHLFLIIVGPDEAYADDPAAAMFAKRVLIEEVEEGNPHVKIINQETGEVVWDR